MCCKHIYHEVAKVTKNHFKSMFFYIIPFYRHKTHYSDGLPKNFCCVESITSWKSLICLNHKTLFSFLVIDFFKISNCCASIYQRRRQKSWTTMHNLWSITQVIIIYFNLLHYNVLFLLYINDPPDEVI